MKLQPLLYFLLALALGAMAIWSIPEKPWYDTVRLLSLAISLLFLAGYFRFGYKYLQYASWVFGGVFVALIVYRLILLAT